MKAKKEKPSYIAWLSSMRFALNLLIGIGVITALGTLVPQGQDPIFYLDHYGEMLGQIIVALSMHKFYQAWWFQLLIGILCFTLLICAYQRLRKAATIKSAGSLLFHLAIAVILVGAAWSLGYAHSAAVEISVGDKISLSPHGFKDGELTLASFNIDYYPDFQPRQYTSDLSLTHYDGRDYQQLVYVNNPLRAGNLKIYQSSWGWIMNLKDVSQAVPQTIKIKNHGKYQLDDTKMVVLGAVFLPDYAEDNKRVFSRTPLPNNPHIGLTLYQAGRLIDAAIIAPGQEAELGAYRFVFEGFTYYSGLQLKYDPGVNLVFLGFGLLLLGLMARYWQLIFPGKGG
ncbi:MAG: cytochrome c biogenesis protein ResB [Syntrophomonadaceae bacterium]|nr:cytochrome c biogenesis protein ResB [Syntrophomonadaceae bacterium]